MIVPEFALFFVKGAGQLHGTGLWVYCGWIRGKIEHWRIGVHFTVGNWLGNILGMKAAER